MDDRTALYDASGRSDGIPRSRRPHYASRCFLNFTTCLKPVSLRELLSQIDQGRLIISAFACAERAAQLRLFEIAVGTMCNILRSAHLET
jgi:hypothetical protein